MRSRPFAVVPALAAGFAMTGLAVVARAETPSPSGEDRPSSEVRGQGQEPSPSPDPRYHEQQIQPDRDTGTRGRELPPVGAQGSRGAPDARAPQAAAGQYVVEEGDTLASIAEKELGDAEQWRQIAKMNQIDDPDDLAVGTRLRLPQRGSMQGPGGTSKSDAPRGDVPRGSDASRGAGAGTGQGSR